MLRLSRTSILLWEILLWEAIWGGWQIMEEIWLCFWVTMWTEGPVWKSSDWIGQGNVYKGPKSNNGGSLVVDQRIVHRL